MSIRTPEDQEMPLVSHLTELRTRLLRCVIAILLIFAALFYFAQDIYALVAAPLRAYLPEGATMIATGVASPFLTPFKLTLVVSLFLGMPVVLQQIWGVIAPGLYKQEKRIAVPLLVSSILLFYAGMAFAYFVVFPIMFGFFASVTPEGVAMMTDIGQYLDFVLTLFFAFGVAFEIPIATFLLIWVGILLAVPMWLLFEVGVFFGAMVKRQAAEAEEAEEHNENTSDQPPAPRP
jgi:sec-independent protein translocase protein TatC